MFHMIVQQREITVANSHNWPVFVMEEMGVLWEVGIKFLEPFEITFVQ